MIYSHRNWLSEVAEVLKIVISRDADALVRRLELEQLDLTRFWARNVGASDSNSLRSGDR